MIGYRGIRKVESFFYDYKLFASKNLRPSESILNKIKVHYSHLKNLSISLPSIGYKDNVLSRYEEVIKIIEDNKLDDAYLRNTADKMYLLSDNNRSYKDGKVYVENRDNKKQVNRGSGCHGNWIRYPSQKRSRSTWKRFYELFPERAILDNWDGEKSDKYKPLSK